MRSLTLAVFLLLAACTAVTPSGDACYDVSGGCQMYCVDVGEGEDAYILDAQQCPLLGGACQPAEYDTIVQDGALCGYCAEDASPGSTVTMTVCYPADTADTAG